MFTVDYFIDKFLLIPEGMWCTETYNNGMGQSCAYGHCGCTGLTNEEYDTEEAEDLFTLIYKRFKKDVSTINDEKSKEFPQPTPKQRILAALYKIKELQS